MTHNLIHGDHTVQKLAKRLERHSHFPGLRLKWNGL
jgi:hypothetical protein